MVLLVGKLAKLYFKLENRHHHHHPQTEELLSSSLHAFQSHVSRFLGQLALDLKPGSEQTLSLTWFQRCFRLFPIINKAFAKLVVDIDYPMSRWENDSIEGYLSYTLSLLQLLNSVSSSISHLGQSKLSLAHGLNLMEKSPSLARKHLSAYLNSCSGLPESIMLARKQLGGVAFPRINPLKATQPFSSTFGEDFYAGDDDKARIFSGKERIVHEGVKEMKSVGFWVCGIVLTCLYGDARPYMELRKIAGGFESSSVATLDFKISEQLMEKMPIFSEIEELNNAVAEAVASDEVRHEETTVLETKLHEFEKLLDGMGKEVDNLFADVMTQRSELINVFRL